MSDVDLHHGEFSIAPLLVRPVVVVASESLLGVIVTALEKQPTRRFTYEEDAEAKDESGHALDGEAETPLVGIVPATFTDAGPESDEEAPGDHCEGQNLA